MKLPCGPYRPVGMAQEEDIVFGQERGKKSSGLTCVCCNVVEDRDVSIALAVLDTGTLQQLRHHIQSRVGRLDEELYLLQRCLCDE